MRKGMLRRGIAFLGVFLPAVFLPAVEKHPEGLPSLASLDGNNDQVIVAEEITLFARETVRGLLERGLWELADYRDKKLEERREEEQERRRNALRDLLLGKDKSEKKEVGPTLIRVALPVPEIAAYEQLAALLEERAKLARQVTRKLVMLDADGDWRLSQGEYRAAHALLGRFLRLLEPVDANNDGVISAEEFQEALAAGRQTQQALAWETKTAAGEKEKGGLAIMAEVRIARFDADGDGTLSTQERKDLSSAFARVVLQAAGEAETCRKIARSLEVERDLVLEQLKEGKFEIPAARPPSGEHGR